MNKTLLPAALALGLALAPLAHARAQAPAAAPTAAPAGYQELMTKTIAALMQAGNPAALASQTEALQRAAALAPADWLPRYYQAYANILQSRAPQLSAADKDKLLDQADALLAQAKQLKGDGSEVAALQAMSYHIRLSISPMERYEQYGELVAQSLDLAKTLNPANPRPSFIEATQVYYTPEEYGGGAAKARPLFEAAKAKFEAFRPASPLAPNWGQRQVLDRLNAYQAAARPAPGGK